MRERDARISILCIHVVVVKHNPFIPSDFQNDTQFKFQLFDNNERYFGDSSTIWIYYILQPCNDYFLEASCQLTFSSVEIVSW